MRVVGTRRRAAPDTVLPDGLSRLERPEHLYALLGGSHAVVVCCQWTSETTELIGREAFAAIKPGVILVNIAPGEIIDEAALIAALAAGTLRGGGPRRLCGRVRA
jgi:lactate dehydrogenase-like 2-hydroxyacid dehydrogenase